MLKKSVILSYVLEQAAKIAESVSDGRVASAHVVFALLGFLNGHGEDARLEMLKQYTKEIDAVNALLEPYQPDLDEAMGAILTGLRSLDEDPQFGELFFQRNLYEADRRAAGDGKSELTADLLLAEILRNPGELLRNAVFSPKKKEEDADLEDWDTLFDIVKKSSDAEESDSAESDIPDDLFADDEDDYERDDDEDEDNDGEEISKRAGKEVHVPDSSKTAREKRRRLAETVAETERMQKYLLSHVFGQDHAIDAFIAGYFQSQTREEGSQNKPRATFLFAGPPGVGKTFLAEQIAGILGRPYCRYDMSEYADKEGVTEFCGSDHVYKDSHPGKVTTFVKENPRCVLLFDEIEKAHINVIHLFLQILDAGRVQDAYHAEEVSFTDTILIFTTNAGKNLYDDLSVANLSTVPRKTVIKALETDKHPLNGGPLFPAAICSRFASGNVVMFNHLGAHELFTIARQELKRQAESFERTTGICVKVDDRIPTAIMLAEGGKTDARTVKGRSGAFFHAETYEFLRLLSSEKVGGSADTLETLRIELAEDMPPEIFSLFSNEGTPEVLVFADEALARDCRKRLGKTVICHTASTVSEAQEILFDHSISVVLCDVHHGIRPSSLEVMNAEDVRSDGHDLLNEVLTKHALPAYLLQRENGEMGREEMLSFSKVGARGVITVEDDSFADAVRQTTEAAVQQSTLMRLARENKVVHFQTAQTVSKDKKEGVIRLFDFRMETATETEDADNVLSDTSKPNISFDDVIGAEDAKTELRDFVNYLKDPSRFVRMGLRAPRGVLLYGPPGTGKTMLAKAMAGEANITFMPMEGNRFLQKYQGEGPRAVHEAFAAARKYAPTVLFIDEIDAIGIDRNSEAGKHTGDTLTAFLTEMDGFHTDTTKPVFVLAATNGDVKPGSARSLDGALTRRFDRLVYVDLPNKEERKRYLTMKASQNRCVSLSEAEIDNIALRSTGMSLAELELVFDMALRTAIRSSTGTVGDNAFEEAFETFQNGERKTWDKSTLERVARHESGHALTCWLGGEKPAYLTVIARGDHGGYMLHGDHENKQISTRAELRRRIRTALGGRAAELVYYGEEDGVSTGASGDLRSATAIAEQMICAFGMDAELGLSSIDPNTADAITRAKIREKVNAVLAEELKNAVHDIQSNRRAIDKMVEALLDKNHLKENEIDKIFRHAVRNR
ncbi:MAG: AAA family ATPase [Clostridia bacterium]|nr:AAA family ATPase [Clostridia bacterium]